MNYIALDERLITQQQEIDEKIIAEMHADKTTIIDDDHPLWIAYQKSKKNRREGKIISLSDAIQQLIDEEED